jgi:hypothetical protein
LYARINANCILSFVYYTNPSIASSPTSLSYTGGKDIMLVKTTPLGVMLWAKTYGGSNTDYAYSVIEHSIDQGLVIAGTAQSFGAGAGDRDAILIKTDTAGVSMWAKTFGGPSVGKGSGSEHSFSVVEHPNGLVVAGKTDTYGAGFDDIMLVIQPSDGLGAGAGADATPTEATQTLTEADLTVTEATAPFTEYTHSIADVDQTLTTAVVFANPSPSISQSPSTTQSLSTTQSRSSSQTASNTKSQSRTPSSSG